jgi:hypothetical protein
MITPALKKVKNNSGDSWRCRKGFKLHQQICLDYQKLIYDVKNGLTACDGFQGTSVAIPVSTTFPAD